MKLDKEGAKQLSAIIKDTERVLGQEKKKERPKESADDWHYYTDKMSLEALVSQLSTLRKALETATIIKKHNDPSSVDVGDLVSLYDARSKEEYQVLLTGKYSVSLDSDPEEITLNSPLGEAIYGKKVGDHAQYKVEDRKFDVVVASLQKEHTLASDGEGK